MSHEIVRDPSISTRRTSTNWQEIFEANIMKPTPQNSFVTFSRSRSSVREITGCRIREIAEEIPHGGQFYAPHESAYWIIKCEKNLIGGHNDIWNERAMHTYGALFGIVRALR